MVRIFNSYYPVRTLFLFFGEVLMVFGSFLVAGLIWFRNDFTFQLQYQGGLERVTLVSVVCLICLYYFDFYATGILTNEFEVTIRLIQVLGTTCLIVGAVYYFYPAARLGIGYLTLALVFVGACLVGSRKLFFTVSNSMNLAQRTVILGAGSFATSLATEIEKRPELGMRLLGYVGLRGGSETHVNGLPHLGSIEELVDLADRFRINQVIVAMGERRGRLPVEALMHVKTRGVRVQDGEATFEQLAGKVPLDAFRLSWLLFSAGPMISKPVLIYKRVTSVVLSTLGLLISFPLMVLVALAIFIDSGLPVLFTQERVGKDGKTFRLFKFRSMRKGIESNGEYKPAQENDDRFTRVGRWIRRMRFDELPQLYNILRGDMNFVGPRPFVPNQERELAEKIPFYRQRWLVKPGATGWAQIHQGYCATVEDNTEKLAYDLFYIKNMSMGLDFLTVLKTVKVLLLGRGAR